MKKYSTLLIAGFLFVSVGAGATGSQKEPPAATSLIAKIMEIIVGDDKEKK